MKEQEWYHDRMYEMRRALAQEQERLTDKAKQLEERMQLVDAMDGLLAENSKQQAEIETLRQQLSDKNQQFAEEKERRQDLEMKLAEMSKLSAVMAKKASEEAVRNALQTYANTSKRKTVDKRTFAKTAILEIANVNGLTLPQDLAAIIECLDDEQPNPKVVNVAGNYNDIHDNATVNQK